MSNRQIQKCKYTNTQIQSIQRSDRKKTCGIFLKQLYNSSNMINAESAQFTRSSFLSVIECVQVTYHPMQLNPT